MRCVSVVVKKEIWRRRSCSRIDMSWCRRRLGLNVPIVAKWRIYCDPVECSNDRAIVAKSRDGVVPCVSSVALESPPYKLCRSAPQKSVCVPRTVASVCMYSDKVVVARKPQFRLCKVWRCPKALRLSIMKSSKKLCCRRPKTCPLHAVKGSCAVGSESGDVCCSVHVLCADRGRGPSAGSCHAGAGVAPIVLALFLSCMYF